MTEPENPQSHPDSPKEPSEQDPAETKSSSPEHEAAREAFDDLGNAFNKAWKAGSRDAQKAAKEAFPKAKDEFSKAFQELAWGVAYVASFGATLAREVTPDDVEASWQKGSAAGKKAAESFNEKQRSKKEADTSGEDPPSDSDPESRAPVLV